MRLLIFFIAASFFALPIFGYSQPKSLRFSATAGINRYSGLKGAYNHPTTEYTWGEAGSMELGFISGKKYLPGQYAIGFVMDYYTGTFHEYGEGLNGVEYLDGKVSKMMLGGYLVPMLFSVNDELFIKPGIEWTYRIKSEVEGVMRSEEGQTFGQMLPIGEEFANKSDFGVALDFEYVIEIKRSNWYFSPRLKTYYSLVEVLPDMKSFRATVGFSIGHRLKEPWYPKGPSFFNER
ncbi:MAG TPA: hypothetical protein VK212_09855 [Lentimicrobium sp.]|nr:hypothetical protein [Lentimicrobium sp.]